MSAGVAEKLQSEFRPTMERMAGSLDQLQAAIVSLESQKQDSVKGEFERMVKALEESITQALSTMGRESRDALTGSARDEFGNVQGTLETTRHVLSEMNNQFSQMQTALGVIIAKVEETTTDQLENRPRADRSAFGVDARPDEQAPGNGGTKPEQRPDAD